MARSQRLRTSVRTFHRLVGLTIGTWFALMGLTGSVLVWYQEIDEWLNPELTVAQPGTQWLPFESILQSVVAAHPDKADGSWEIGTALHSHGMHEVRFPAPPERAGAFYSPLMLTVDPYTGEVTSSRYWGDYLVTWLFELHSNLLLGEWGWYAVGLLGFFVAISLFCGVALWWPTGPWKTYAFTISFSHGSARTLYDLHRVAGILASPLLLLSTLTGAAIVYSAPLLKPLAELVSPVPPAFEAVTTTARPDMRKLAISEAVAISEKAFPQSTLRWIVTPDGPTGTYRIDRRQPGEANVRWPASRVWIDPYTGDILRRHDPYKITAAGTFFNLLYPLHIGEAFGLAGRWLVFAAGFVPAVLLATAILRRQRRWRAHVPTSPELHDA